MRLEDLKLEAVIVLRPDGSPSEAAFNVRRQYLNDDGTQAGPSHVMRQAASIAEIAAVLDSGAFAQNAETVGLHQRIAELRDELAATKTMLAVEREKVAKA